MTTKYAQEALEALAEGRTDQAQVLATLAVYERLKVTHSRLALTLPEAAEAVGYSLESVRAAIRRGDLVPSYANSKPVVMVEELERWLRSLPAEDDNTRVWPY